MKYLVLLFSFVFFISCSTQKDKELRIAVNSWIGYTPLFYAKEKAYLKNINIKLIPTVSLGESTDIFSVTKVDMLTATQHEYNALKTNFPTLMPIILIDRSDGGDMILSNKTIKELQNTKKITVLLEIDSINNELIKDFIKKYHIDKSTLSYKNKDQSQIQDTPYTQDNAIIIVTYAPYNLQLLKDGFKEIASTKDMNTLLVIDAVCVTKETFQKNKQTLLKLKKVIDTSIEEIQKDPHAAYELTKKYLGNITYEEFEHSLTMIKWINHPDKKLFHALEKIGYKEGNIIQ